MGNNQQEPDYEPLRYPSRIREASDVGGSVGRTSGTAGLEPVNHGSRPYKGSLFNAGGLRPPDRFRTGNASADQGFACDDGVARQGCLMDAAQRQIIVAQYQGRVNAALSAYLSALTKLGIEELLRKEEEHIEWVTDLLVDVIGALVSKAAVTAFRLLRSGHAAADLVTDANALAHELAVHGEAEITEVVNTAIAAGKKALPPPISPEKPDLSTPNPASEKVSTLAYVQFLKDQASSIYERLREDAIAGADDSTLLVMFTSFGAAKGHTDSHYQAALEAQLGRFKKSGLANLGVTRNKAHQPYAADERLESFRQVETKVFWVKGPQGKRLGIYSRGYKPVPDEVMATVGYRDTTPAEKVVMAQRDLAQRPFRFVSYVEDDLVKTAVAMHVARWHTEPFETVARTPEELAFAGVRQ